MSCTICSLHPHISAALSGERVAVCHLPLQSMQSGLLVVAQKEAGLQVSYMILQRVSPVTHSIGNCLKRVIVIIASVVIFQNSMGQRSILGAQPPAPADGGPTWSVDHKYAAGHVEPACFLDFFILSAASKHVCSVCMAASKICWRSCNAHATTYVAARACPHLTDDVWCLQAPA